MRWWFAPALPTIPSHRGSTPAISIPTLRRENEHVDHHHPPDHSRADSGRRSADVAVQLVLGLYAERCSRRHRHRDARAVAARKNLAATTNDSVVSVERPQKIELAELD